MKLEKLFLTKVVGYLDSVSTAINFFSINKKCTMISTMLKINPFFGDNAVTKEIKLFPNIETLRCNTNFLVCVKTLPESVKYIHIISGDYWDSSSEKKIPKNLLLMVTSFTTNLTKLSILKQMNNLEYLKVICCENRKINGEVFKEVKHNDNLKNLVIDTRECDNKFVIGPLLTFDSSKIHTVVICSELNEIISKKNVTIVCTNGNSESTKMLTNEYIPFQKCTRPDRNDKFLREAFERRKPNQYYFKQPVSERYFYKYDLNSFENMDYFNGLYNKTLPLNLTIDVGKKKGVKVNAPNKINLKNPDGKIIDITLPSSVQKLGISGSSFNITTPNDIKELLYYEPAKIQTDYINITELSILNSKMTKPLDLSEMVNLKVFYFSGSNDKIIFPKQELDDVDLGSNELVNFENLSTKKLSMQQMSKFKSLDNAKFNELSLKSIKGCNFDLSNHSSLTSLKVEYTTGINSLPISLQNFCWDESWDDGNLQHFSSIVSNLTNLEIVKIPTSFISAIATLPKLKLLETKFPYRSSFGNEQKAYTDYSDVDLSGLTKLVELSFGAGRNIPIFPSSITKLVVHFGYGFTAVTIPTINFSHISNLQELEIRSLTTDVILPSSLTCLNAECSAKKPLNFKNIPIKKLDYSTNNLTKQFVLPTTLESCRLFVSDPSNVTLPDLSKLTNLVDLSYQFGYSGNGNKQYYGPWHLPSSLQSLYNSCEKNNNYGI
ncbi:hypothetical protein QTN25_008047 [Entamoeba marina]